MHEQEIELEHVTIHPHEREKVELHLRISMALSSKRTADALTRIADAITQEGSAKDNSLTIWDMLDRSYDPDSHTR